MGETEISAIAHVIQLSVAPVFLLSGIGAMLAVMTNRLSRIIERARVLEGRLEEATPDRTVMIDADLEVLTSLVSKGDLRGNEKPANRLESGSWQGKHTLTTKNEKRKRNRDVVPNFRGSSSAASDITVTGPNDITGWRNSCVIWHGSTL